MVKSSSKDGEADRRCDNAGGVWQRFWTDKLHLSNEKAKDPSNPRMINIHDPMMLQKDKVEHDNNLFILS